MSYWGIYRPGVPSSCRSEWVVTWEVIARVLFSQATLFLSSWSRIESIKIFTIDSFHLQTLTTYNHTCIQSGTICGITTVMQDSSIWRRAQNSKRITFSEVQISFSVANDCQRKKTSAKIDAHGKLWLRKEINFYHQTSDKTEHNYLEGNIINENK